MPFEITGGGAPDIADGTYPAVLESVEELEGGQYGRYRKWHWLVENNGQITPLSTMTSANTGPNTVSFKYLTALLGTAPKVGERIEDPTGTRVLLTLQKNEKGWPKIVDDGVQPYTEPQQVLPGVPR